MKIKRLMCIILSVFMTLTAVGCGYDGKSDGYDLDEDKKLIVYTAHKSEIYEPIIQEFEERTGIWVEVVSGGTNQILERIAEENGKQSGDVMFGGGVDSLEAYSTYFDTYVSPVDDKIGDSYKSADNKYVKFSDLPTVIIYNRKLVISAGTPRSYGELVNSRWKGKIAMADPEKSGSAYTALLTMVQVISKATGETSDDVIAKIAKNVDGGIIDGSQNVVNAVATGEKLVGITSEENALKNMTDGTDIAMIYPSEGTSVIPDGAAIIKNAPHRSNAEKFMEFVVSDDVQRLLEDNLYRRSVRKDITTKKKIKEISYDIDYSEKNRQSILECWQKEAGSGSEQVDE